MNCCVLHYITSTHTTQLLEIHRIIVGDFITPSFELYESSRFFFVSKGIIRTAQLTSSILYNSILARSEEMIRQKSGLRQHCPLEVL